MSAARRQASLEEEATRRIRGDGPAPSRTDPRAVQAQFDQLTPVAAVRPGLVGWIKRLFRTDTCLCADCIGQGSECEACWMARQI